MLARFCVACLYFYEHTIEKKQKLNECYITALRVPTDSVDSQSLRPGEKHWENSKSLCDLMFSVCEVVFALVSVKVQIKYSL